MKALAEIYTIHSFAPLESNLSRHPGEKQSTGEETIRLRQRSEAWGKEMKKMQKPLCSDSANENCADSKDEILFYLSNLNFSTIFFSNMAKW